MRIFLIVIDSFGIGAMPDAAQYGDDGSNTYGNVVASTGVSLPNLISLGLNNIDGVAKKVSKERSLNAIPNPQAAYARLSEKTPAKDTTAGHYEIAGLVLANPFKVYNTFPEEIVHDIEKAAGVQFIGNEVASGTEIIQRLGPLHLKTGCPILYTSQDSVLQIAADISIISLEELYRICEVARSVMVGPRAVGRVIARPFVHENGKFRRTEDRKDFALKPPGKTLLDILAENCISVTSVGKIQDIFCGRGIAKSIHTGNNEEGLRALCDLSKNAEDGLIFANLVDTDMLYGHRNDAIGYASALKFIDNTLPKIIKNLEEKDILILTADHGCDPTTPSTDHSREYVPLLIYGTHIKPVNLGTIEGFDCISSFVKAAFGLQKKDRIFDLIYLH